MRKISFNTDWTCNGNPVTLPHDAMISEERSADASDSGHGFFPGGIYTYEKKFTVDPSWKDKDIILEFEGVYKNTTVSLNGNELIFHPYGYTNFFVELNDLKEENTLTVVADNSKLPNSRWYTGSGIYRPVWLYVCEKDGIRPQSVQITTESYDPAVIRVRSQVPVTAEIQDIGASGEGIDFTMEIPDAHLWSDTDPYLYTAHITAGDSDTTDIRFGIRKIEWSPDGLFINGKNTLLRGGCIHHDNGVLGAATYKESEYRRIRIMKENGFNAIRSSHNPASTALLEACDELGMYVMDETFDMWYNRKTQYDYGLDFEKNWKNDTAAMVEHDISHPSVIMYSIGNEVSEPCEQKGIETGQKMVDLVHSLDNTRPVTCGANLMIITRAAKGNGIYKDGQKNTAAEKKKDKAQNASLAFNMLASMIGTGMNKAANSKKADQITTPFLDELDICGYNYSSGRYPLEGKAHPDRIVFGSETFPQDIWKNWQMVKEFPYLIGDFMWTSWDYIGEAGIGAWSYTGGMPFDRPYPWVLAGAGVIDITGQPDGSCKYASTVWGLEKKPVIAVRPVNHPGVRVSKSVWRGTNAFPSWSYRDCDGNKAIAEIYSDADSVELLINGHRIGHKKIKECRAVFKTRYESGTIQAIAYDSDGRAVAESTLISAGDAKVTVTPEKTEVKPGEIVYIPVCIADKNGIIECNNDQKVQVTVENGELLGFGSANPCTTESFTDGSYTTYYGRALAVIRAGQSGKMTIHANDAEGEVVIR